MKIAFNATALISPMTGVGQYAFQLGRRLLSSHAHEIGFFYGYGWSDELRSSPVAAAASVLPWLRRHLPYAYEIKRLVQMHRFRQGTRRRRFDLYHEPNFLALDFEGPSVVTVHDLSWLRHPEAHPVERVRALSRYFEPGLRRATVVLTDSGFVRQEVLDTFGLAPDRVVAVPLGVSEEFLPRDAEATAAVRAGLGLVHGSYLLAVGTLEPRKNLGAALRAHRLLPERMQLEYPLVISGMSGWGNEALEAELRAAQSRGTVKRTGYLSRDHLASLTAGATALVYPSLYEGFGLPLLEAMSCRVPVITSNRSSMPEVAGDAGVLIEPDDPETLGQAMRQMVESPAWRDDFALRGYRRATGFSWDRCAAETVAAYEQAIRLWR